MYCIKKLQSEIFPALPFVAIFLPFVAKAFEKNRRSGKIKSVRWTE